MRQPQDYIIFPLDVPATEDAERLVRLLSGHVGMFKVGLELFIKAGPGIVRFIRQTGDTPVFLDLKLHDIPVTVSRAMAKIADLGVAFATVHCEGGRQMLQAAVEGSGGRVGVLGVTVLTSLDRRDVLDAGYREELAADMPRLVTLRAETAKAAGCAGVICSGLEVEMVKQRISGEFLAVVPGIRPAKTDRVPDDQRRVATPARAIQWGADYLVIGRPIRDARDPLAAARRIADEIKSALDHPKTDELNQT